MFTQHKILRAVIVSAFAAVSALVGCASDQKPAQQDRVTAQQETAAPQDNKALQPDRDDRRDRGDNDRRDRDDHDRDRDSHRDEQISGVPRDAVLLDGGINHITTRASDRGTLYLFDATDNRVMWSGYINRDDVFTLDAGDNKAAINGQSIVIGGLQRGHEFRVYLDPAR